MGLLNWIPLLFWLPVRQTQSFIPLLELLSHPGVCCIAGSPLEAQQGSGYKQGEDCSEDKMVYSRSAIADMRERQTTFCRATGSYQLVTSGSRKTSRDTKQMQARENLSFPNI